MARGTARFAWVIAIVAIVAFLPFGRGVLSGQSFYFRDLSIYFFPLRHFVVEGLLKGEIRYWNPYVHEGTPVTLPPVSYPLDLLQCLLPNESGLSLVLALHVPLAAVALMVLARSLGCSLTGAAAGGLVYALGGFCLSSLNLYIYLQAVAWAPLVVLGLLRAAQGSARDVALAAVLTALALSTTGVEVVLQAILFGVVLSARPREPARSVRVGSALVLGGGLSGATLLVMWGLLGDTARAGGFPVNVVLAHSIHPITFLQVVVGDLYGDLSDIANRWWGTNFFPRGFPYLLSLYLGSAALCVAVVGARDGKVFRVRLALLALLAAFLCLGRWGGLAPLVDLLPALRKFRYPSKVFFTVHLAVALLTALGMDALEKGPDRSTWRRLAALGLASGALLVIATAVPWAFPGPTRWLLSGFLPTEIVAPFRFSISRHIAQDAALGGLVALAAGVVALIRLRGWLRPTGGCVALVGLIAADLVRTGAGLNPMVAPSFYRLSRETSQELGSLREGGRVFTCEVSESSAYLRARAAKPARHEVWSFATMLDTLTPELNLLTSIPTAYSVDLTMLVPVDRVLSTEEASCRSFATLVGRLRGAGIAHVISLDPLSHPDLRLRAVVEPSRIAPLAIHIYALTAPLPLRFVASSVRTSAGPSSAKPAARSPALPEDQGVVVEGLAAGITGASGRVASVAETPDEIEMVVEADGPTVVVVRDAHAAGWSARVNGSPAPVLRADGRHRAVPVPAGTSRVVLSYRPPGLWPGLTLTIVSSMLVLLLWRRRRRRPAVEPGQPH